MADPTVTTNQTTASDDGQILMIPPEVQEKFPDIVELIKGSKSMNDEERQYWVDVLPIMTEDQLKNLRGILDNEKKQLAEAAATYASEAQSAQDKAKRAFNEVAYLEKKKLRRAEEAEHEDSEKEAEEAILAEISSL